MFDRVAEELDANEAVQRFRTLRVRRLQVEDEQLLLAAHWATLFPADRLPRAGSAPVAMLGERGVQLGGPGTPRVAEFAAAELGPEIGLSIGQASGLLADALDLRHRFPLIWRRVRAWQVREWVVRRVARRTRELSLEQCGRIDRILVGDLTNVTSYRLDNLIDAAILRVAADRAAALIRSSRRARGVRLGQSNEYGIKSLYARLDAADAIWLDGMVDRIADILQAAPTPIAGVPERHAETREEWRAVALAVLAKPLLAAKILIMHEHPDLLEDPAPEDDHVTADRVRPRETSGDPTAFVRDQREHRKLRRLLTALDLDRLGSPAVLYLHCSAGDLAKITDPTVEEAGVGRVEGIGPVLLQQLRDWLGAGCQVRLRPVLDLRDNTPVDGYEVPTRMRESVLLRHPASVFPYGTNLSRGMDLDHTIAYARSRDGTPVVDGQTRPDNLAPLGRAEHRAKTHGRVRLRRPEPDTHVWRTPYGRVLVTNPDGTHDLGTGTFARTVWNAARQPDEPARAS